MKKALFILALFCVAACQSNSRKGLSVLHSTDWTRIRSCLEYQADKAIANKIAFQKGAYDSASYIANICQSELKMEYVNQQLITSQAYYVIEPKMKEYLDLHRSPL